ncbi:MAG: S-methyl-5-thioribose-1-phosphate isomerase [Candidatus Zixiibacteriota bacterium]|nr:MAG: S-methyl-5-thioribose-1-phosphate isomerase [candidate division Zixibacteria bacterium]
MTIEQKLDFATLKWKEKYLRIIDQRQLPEKLVYFDCYEVSDFVEAIKNLVIRGAPAIGCTAAYGIAIAAKKGDDLIKASRMLQDTRPTAVNLSWAVNRMMNVAKDCDNDPLILEKEAVKIHNEDASMCRRIGEFGAELIKDGDSVLTHCNAGALATGGIGTALGIVYTAFFSGKDISVWVDETRPMLQGARLTAWELGRVKVPHTLICDNVAASLMAKGKVDCVITGADRIAANYDVANKIGTYNLAVLCHHHKIPFYVAAPSSTLDSDCPDGKSVVIEQRPADEVSLIKGQSIAPGGVNVYNPAFDITPSSLIAAVITENGITEL